MIRVTSTNKTWLQEVRGSFRKWWAVFLIFIQEGIAYRASGVIWVLTDVVTAVTMPMVWISANQGQTIRGFTDGGFVLYYLCGILISSFVTSHLMFEVALEIKDGKFVTQLVRPIGLYPYMFLRNLAWRFIRPILFVPFFIALLFAYSSYLGDVQLYFGWAFWVSLFMGHLVSFTLVMMLSPLALFTEEAMAFFELYYLPLLFLSGQVVPLATMPDWARNLASVLPFYATTGLPTEILVKQRTPEEATYWIGIQAFWIVVHLLVGKWLWKKGLKQYAAVGM